MSFCWPGVRGDRVCCMAMKMNLKISAVVMGVALACWAAPAWSQPATPQQDNGVKHDLKTAGHKTKDAGKDVAHGTKTVAKDTSKDTKKAAHATAHGTKKVWHKTKDVTKGAVHGAKEGAKDKPNQ
jgi:hypothetical protein